MKMLKMLVVLLLAAVSLSAAPKAKIKIALTSSADKFSQQISDEISAKLNLTERYTVVAKGAEVGVYIGCLKPIEQPDSSPRASCIVSVFFYGGTAIVTMQDFPTVGFGTVDFLASKMFSEVVNDTSDEKIDTNWKSNFSFVQEVCSLDGVEKICQPNPKSETH